MCKPCFTHSSPKGDQFIDFETLVDILDGREYDSPNLYGGEHFLHPQSEEIYKFLLDKYGKIIIYTNGSQVPSVRDEDNNIDLENCIEATRKNMAPCDNKLTKVYLSINSELMKQGPNLLNAVILHHALKEAELAFSIRYFKGERKQVLDQFERIRQSDGISKRKFTVYPYVAMGRGENLGSRVLQIGLDRESLVDFIMPSGEVLSNHYQVSQMMKSYVQH